jgi:hypothetical protein
MCLANNRRCGFAHFSSLSFDRLAGDELNFLLEAKQAKTAGHSNNISLYPFVNNMPNVELSQGMVMMLMVIPAFICRLISKFYKMFCSLLKLQKILQKVKFCLRFHLDNC